MAVQSAWAALEEKHDNIFLREFFFLSFPFPLGISCLESLPGDWWFSVATWAVISSLWILLGEPGSGLMGEHPSSAAEKDFKK